jgi:hypothetical protein
MKSAYELALERIESQGIARPKEDSLTDAQREQVADIRRQAEARIAELEILHRDRLQHVFEPPSARRKSRSTSRSATASRSSASARSRNCAERRARAPFNC